VVEVQAVGSGILHCCNQPMQMVTESLTVVNLMKAFAGESQARNRYEYFAKVARKEGYNDIANHFNRAAKNEKTHAKLELNLKTKIVDGQGSSKKTKDNLQLAIDGENYEYTTMYPEFARIAKEEGQKESAILFKGIGKIEIEHEKMFKTLLERLDNETEFVSKDENEAWICEVCGHIHYGKKAPKNCPVCKHSRRYQSRLNGSK
jgi:rubrerythrin